MTSRERVEAALNFEPVDYVPLADHYWGNFIAAWRVSRGLPPLEGLRLDDAVDDDTDLRICYNVDVVKTGPMDAPWPSKAGVLSTEGRYTYLRDVWGRVVKLTEDSVYGEPVELPLNDKSQLDAMPWQSPEDDGRFTVMLDCIANVQARMKDPYIYLKSGGPYLRSSFMRGEVQWYMDLVQDEDFACALMDRTTDHIIAAAVEGYKRSGLKGASMWIYDDVASNHGPLVSPDTYERLILPRIARMVKAYKAAGAPHVGLHSDGDIRPLLDGLVDAGISAINPIEPQAGMDVVALRQRYGKRLAYVGGLCNSRIMPFGSDEAVRGHVEHVLSIEEESGLVLGSHTISGDISIERYEYIMKILEAHGRPAIAG